MKITQFQILGMPTPLGKLQLNVYGLGEDSKMYIWNPESVAWQLVDK